MDSVTERMCAPHHELYHYSHERWTDCSGVLRCGGVVGRALRFGETPPDSAKLSRGKAWEMLPPRLRQTRDPGR